MPEKVVTHPRIKQATLLLPVGLLAALIAVSTLTTGSQAGVDARLAGLAAWRHPALRPAHEKG